MIRDMGLKTVKALKSNILIRAVMVLVILVLVIIMIFSMTAAWFSNVTQTGGLIFTTESWDFDGTFSVTGSTVKAQPGDSGYIDMSMTNNGETTVIASVSTSRELMDEQMKKRIYFYVGASDVRNGEMIDRVWISSVSSYNYSIFPGNALTSSENSGSIPSLKWMWVYDVLGYYVMGTGNNDGTVNIVDYIRPVEYDYDPIKTTFDTDGKLKTIDGKTRVDTFLEELTKNDGYEGSVKSISKFNDKGYCRIDVNEAGYGIWLYLCNRDEIIANTEADTLLGTTEDFSCTAKVNLTGANSRIEPIEISSVETLKTFITSPTATIATLTSDITLNQTLELSNSTYAVLDLGGHTINSTAANIVSAVPGSTLTLTNGTISGGDNTVSGIRSIGANVTLNDVTITGVQEGVNVVDFESTDGAYSTILISNCDITGSEDGLWIRGTSDKSDMPTKVAVQDSVIKGTNYIGILCNGTYWGTEITVDNSTVEGMYTSIYHPQKDSTLSVSNSTLSGMTGIAVKGGVVNISDCTISGTATTHQAPSYNKSGFSDTGDGIYLEAGYEWNAEINISGSNTNVTSKAPDSYAVRKYKDDAENSKIVISGGSFGSDVTAYLAEGTTCSQTEGKYIVNSQK